MKKKIFRLGLTGPSGAGKSSAAKCFLSMGVPVLSADTIYSDLLSEGGACVRELRHAFGDGIFKDGQLDRKALAKIVFSPKGDKKRLLLNSITHKHVALRTEQMANELESMGFKYCIIDAPLLIEAGMRRTCDMTVAVLADTDVRRARIIARDSLTEEEANMRLSKQKDDLFYIANTDKTIYNNEDSSSLLAECKRIADDIGVLEGVKK